MSDDEDEGYVFKIDPDDSQVDLPISVIAESMGEDGAREFLQNYGMDPDNDFRHRTNVTQTRFKKSTKKYDSTLNC